MLKLGGEIIDLTKEGSSFGIDKLKGVSTSILKAVKKFKNRAKDGLNFWEKVRTGIDFGTIGGEIVADLDTIKDEFIDLNEKEMEELAEHIADELGIGYTTAIRAVSEIVVEVIDVVLSGVKIYKNVKKLL